MSKDNLVVFNADPWEFLCQFDTINKTWVHHFQPKIKQSKQWQDKTVTADYCANLLRELQEKLTWKLALGMQLHQDCISSQISSGFCCYSK